jgi:ribonuclease J
VRVIPLGGAGEIGKNMYVVEHDGRMVVIDCGVTFPKHDQMGVDLVLPDFGYVLERAEALEAIILTHGHEDHIGAVPFLLRELGRQVPIYGRRFTLALLRPKLGEHGLADDAELVEVAYGGEVEVGPFTAEFIPITHSMPDCSAVALSTPLGTILHTGDFGIEFDPVDGRLSDLPALFRLGERGVRLLLADSTNATESDEALPFPNDVVRDRLTALFATAPGRVLVTTFSSHIHRMQQVLDTAYRDGRAVALVGRSLTRNANIAANLMDPDTGRPYLSVPPGTLVSLRELEDRPRDEQVIICTGSQGEPMAALSRIARGEHPHVEIAPGDTVLYSSSTVPGNELAVNEIVNRLVRRGARVLAGEADGFFHLSGHGRARDLLYVMQFARPAEFAPIHGEAKHQIAHARLATRAFGMPRERIHVLENGDVLEVRADGAEVVEHVDVRLAYVDQAGGGDVAESVLRDRRHLADDGVVLVIARVDAENGAPAGEVEVITRGFGPGDDLELIEETRLAVERSLEASAEQRVTEVDVLRHQLHDAVASLLKKRTQQRPMVLPVIVEV